MEPRVRVVGPLTVEHQERELTGTALGGARERRLLAILACARGTPVTKAELIERLWNRPPRDPDASVDTAVSLVRRALGSAASMVETRRPGYRLAGSIDLAEADQLEANGHPEEALALVSGEFLAGEPVTEWVHEQRRDLARRRVDLLVAAGRAAATRGDDEAALSRAAAAVDADPFREDAHRELIQTLARLGRSAEALRAYEHCRRVLREGLGVDPAGETSAVYEQVLAGRPPERATPITRPREALPFLGRHRELARLTVPVSGCAMRAVLGEPGIGKSRLVEEALAHLTPAHARATKCFRLVAPVPYAVLTDLAPGLVPDVTSGSSITEDPGPNVPLSPEAAAARLATNWADDLERTPTTLVVDDLQWADEPSLLALGLALRRRPRGLLVLATARNGELHEDSPAAQLLELAAGIGVLDRVTLGPLQPEDLAAAGLSFDDWQRSGGHPLFLTQLVRGGEGDLGELILDRAMAAGTVSVEVLRAAAVLDRAASLDELATLAQLDADATRGAADRLRVAGLLTESRGTWHTRHDVISELVRTDLAEPARSAWHGRALAMLTRSGAFPAELAHQALAAGDWLATLRHSLDAGDAALVAFANRDAVAHYARALRVSDEHGVGDLGDQRRAAAGQARALIVLGRTAEAAAVLDRLAPSEGRDEVERLLLEAECAWAAWKPSQAVGPAQRALEIAEHIGDEQLAGRVHAFAANPYGSLGEFDLASAHIDAALAIAAHHGQQPPAVVLYRLSLVQHQRGQEDDALSTLDRCREAAREQHDERTLVFERIVRTWALGALGRYGEALATLDDVAAIGKGEEAVARARVPNTRASLLADIGLIEMALDADEESLEIARAHGGAAIAEPQIHTLLNLATDHLRLGDPDKATTCLAEAEDLSVDAEYARFRYLNRLHWVRGLLSLEAGDIDAALEEAATTSAMATRYTAPKYTVRAELLRGLALGRRQAERPAAVDALRASARLAERHGFAALAEEAHRHAAALTDSTHHARRARSWKARIAASVTGPLRDRLE